MKSTNLPIDAIIDLAILQTAQKVGNTHKDKHSVKEFIFIFIGLLAKKAFEAAPTEEEAQKMLEEAIHSGKDLFLKDGQRD